MTKIIIEKYNVSDIDYLVNDIYINSGEKLAKDQLIATLESSKAAIDIESPCDGYLYHKFIKGTMVSVGNLVAVITEDPVLNPDELFGQDADLGILPQSTSEFRISKKALLLINQHSIDPFVFSGKSIVKEADVYEYLNNTAAEVESLQEITITENTLVIIGGMGGAKMCIDAIRSANKFSILGIIDPSLKIGALVMGVKVLGGETILQKLYDLGLRNLVISFSNLSNLAARFNRCTELKNMGFKFPNIIHAKALVEPSAVLGHGNLVLATSMVGSEVVLGNFNYINTGALLCHESVIGDNNHFAPNSVIAGRVNVGNNTLVGMNATTYFDIKIGSNVIINNGVNVYSSIPDKSLIKYDK